MGEVDVGSRLMFYTSTSVGSFKHIRYAVVCRTYEAQCS